MKTKTKRGIQWGVLLGSVSLALSKAVPALAVVIPGPVSVALLAGAAVLGTVLPQPSAPAETASEEQK